MTPQDTGADPSTYSTDWLTLREPADAAARSTDLVDLLRGALRVPARRTPLVLHDLGCGAGSMGRWLAPLLPGPQHWVLHDRDRDLLAVAAARPGRPPSGAVTVETRYGALGALTTGDLVGGDLVTASALLDVLTAGELEHVVAAVAGAGVPALFALTVAGRVALDPADPADGVVVAAFNSHQRRRTGGRRLLGPAATGAAVAAFGRHGYTVTTRPSPWRLAGPKDAALVGRWLDGWLGAAADQSSRAVRPDYAAARREEAAQGRLGVVVEHIDLLATPPAS